MWTCHGCKETAQDSNYLKYQLHQLHQVILRDSDGQIWLRCVHCKKRGHAKCLYSSDEWKVMKLERYTCHSAYFHNFMQKINKHHIFETN